MSIEGGQISQGTHCNVGVDAGQLGLRCLGQPIVLKSFLSTWSLVLVESEKLRDEVFAVLGHALPDWVVEREFPELDFLHDFLVGRAIKWWDTRKNDVRNNTTGPDVTFSTVRFGENFWSNIVWSSEFLVKLFVFLEHK